MACLKVQGPNYIRVIPEGLDGNVRGVLPTERIIGAVMQCGPDDAAYDLESWLTSEGLMVGNIIKSVATAIGIKQCLACKGRQKRYNRKGLEIQKVIKDLF